MPKKKITYRLMSVESDGEKEFFSVMGKFFASMQIRRDFGYPIYDDNRLWLVALVSDRVIGFGSFGIDKKGRGRLYDAWVDPEYRGQGIYKSIINYRLAWLHDHHADNVLAVVKPRMKTLYERHGFSEEKCAGQYSYMSGKADSIFD